jgi:beta-lactamase regulating signal transducer with metallopeptidase domain
MSGWIVETLAATTLLMGLVLLVRGHVAAMFGPRIAYLLWLLPALRMILPPLPESFGPPPMGQLPAIVDLSGIDLSVLRPVAAAAVPVAPAVDWASLFVGVWLGGAALMLAWHLIAYHRFVRAALRDSVDLPELDSNGIEVCASRLVEGPFAAGVLLPTIVLPHDYRTRYSAEELRLAMTHEAIHHRRGDLSVNMLALGMLSLHWFNPVAWRAWRAFRADQELACDAAVLQGASSDERCSYATALVKSACRRTPVAACSLNPRDQLKIRLRMMRDARERGVSGRVMAAVLVGGGLILTASGGIAAETGAELGQTVKAQVIAPVVTAVTTRVTSSTEIADMPVPPSAPLTPVPPRLASLPEVPAAPLAPAVPDAPVAVPAPPAPPAVPVPHAAPVVFTETVKLAVASNGSICAAQARPIVQSFSTHDGRVQRRVVVCVPAMNDAEIKRVRLDAMKSARRGLIQARTAEREQLERALERLDAQIERLETSMEELD